MRPFEILIPILLAVHLLWRRPRPAWLLPALALLVIVIHVIIEGYRWQMIPLYVLTGMLALWSVLKIEVRHLGSLLSLLLLAVSTALPILLPVPTLPAPDGAYQVGTRLYELTDTSRQEIYSGKEEARQFQIQVWYPS